MPLLDEPSLLDELLAQVRSADPATKEAVEVALKQLERLPWVPNIGPQTDAYDSPADETFYGGRLAAAKPTSALASRSTRTPAH
jgi:hypothetical protein